jgi:heat shock protein HslJ
MVANRVVAAALLSVLVAACGGSGSTAAVQPKAAGDPEALVGSWFVAAAGEEAQAILTIGGGLSLSRECGTLDGGWRANAHAMFVGDFFGGSGHCFENQRNPFPEWMTKVAGFRPDGDSELLLSSDGRTVATLTPGARSSLQPITREMRDGFAEPARLPTGVSPATADDAIGRWLPMPEDRPEGVSDKAFVKFDVNGTYKGSDGCNAAGGRYAVGPDGLVLATNGPTTLVGCDNSPLPAWPADAGRLGLRDGRLVFVDPAGKVLGEAVRA